MSVRPRINRHCTVQGRIHPGLLRVHVLESGKFLFGALTLSQDTFLCLSGPPLQLPKTCVPSLFCVDSTVPLQLKFPLCLFVADLIILRALA